MVISNMIKNLGNNQARLSKYQEQVNTGKKISVPSDDPVVAARALKLRTDVAKVEQYQKNIGDAQSWLDATDEAMSKLGDVLQRARELTVQAANGTNTPEETQKISAELKQLKIQAIHQSNSTYAGRYIFSGYKTDQKVMNDDETSANFGKYAIDVNTTGEKIFYEVGVGDSISINVTGGDLFNLGLDASNSSNGISTSQIDKLTYPYTVDATNDAISISVDGNPSNPLVATIPPAATPGGYTDAASLAKAIQDAVNTQIDTINVGLPVGSAPMLPIEVSIDAGHIELRTTSKTSTSAITITNSGFFASVNATNTVETTGDVGETPSMIKMFDDVIAGMEKGDSKAISNQLDTFDEQIGNVLRVRADVGARQNRMVLTEDRMSNDLINFTEAMSNNENVDVAEAIMNLKNEESVFQASLAAGARIIQQSLVDFLK